MLDTDQLVEECLGDVLRRHQEEIRSLETQLAEVQGWKQPVPSISEVQQNYISEVRCLESQLASLRQRHPPAWFHGPAVSIEHELARRRHLGEAQRVEAALVGARLRLERLGLSLLVGQQGSPVSEPVHLENSNTLVAREAWSSPAPMAMQSVAMGSDANAVGLHRPAARPHAQPQLGPPSCSVLSQPPATFPDSPAEIAPEHVVVERRRRFGDWLFRLWVQDCAFRRGVRVHAMDVVSLARTHAEVCDEDLQAMYNHFVHRRRELARRRWTAFEACPASDVDHDQELQDFLICLLDAAYFELDEGRDVLELRLPKRVDPPLSERQAHDIIEVGKSKDTQDSHLTLKYIRERILVPRSVLTETRLNQRLAAAEAGSSMASCISQFCGDRSLDRSARGSERGTCSSRPRSARSTCPQCARGRPPEQDFSVYMAPPWQPPSAPPSSRPRSASSSGRLRAVSSCRANSCKESCDKRPRPSSARGPRKPPAPSRTCTSSRRPSSRGRRLEVSDMSSASYCSIADAGCSAVGPPSHSEVSAAMEYAQALEMQGQLQASSYTSPSPGDQVSLDVVDSCRQTDPCYLGVPARESRGRAESASRGTSRDEPRSHGSAHVREAWANDAKSASAPRRRPPRPSSAKALKHKRVADSHEQPTLVYEDTEASVCGDATPAFAEQASDHAAFGFGSDPVPLSSQQPLGEPRSSTPPPRFGR